MASGTGAQVAIIRTGSLDYDISSVIVGSINAGWQWTNFVSESIEHNIEELEEGSITGNHDAPPSHKGTDFGEGDVQFEPNPNAIGAWIFAACGTQSNDLVTEASSTGSNSGPFAGQAVTRHSFAPRKEAHDAKSFNEPHAIMVFKDVGSAWWANGAVLTALQFSVSGGALLTSRASLMAKGMELQGRTNTQSSLVTSGGRPWVWDTVSFQLSPGTDPNSLAAFDCFESLDVDLQIPHEGVVKLSGEKRYAEIQKNDFRRVALSGTTTFRTQSEYVAFRNYEPRYLRITARNVNSPSLLLGNPDSAFFPTLQIDVPRFLLTSFSAPVGGPNRITATINGKAERATDNSSHMIEFLLTNVVSSY